MKLLLLNQFFHPDLSATAQIATDLAEDLAAGGIEVTALAARGSYLGGERLPARDRHRGIAIRRLWATSLGKRTLLHRGLDYASFYASAALALPGGLLRYGMGPYRLPRDILDREIGHIERLGVSIRTSTPIDSNPAFNTSATGRHSLEEPIKTYGVWFGA